MLEILVVWFLAQRIGNIAKRKGHKAGLYKTLVVLLWIAGEIVGASIGFVLFRNQFLLVYVVALIGAGGGAFTAYLITQIIPAGNGKIPFLTSSRMFIVFGIIGFGLGLAVARVGWGYLYARLELYRTYGNLIFSYRIEDLISYMLACISGGGMLALATERKRNLFWSLAGLAGGIVGYLVSLPVCCVLDPNPVGPFLVLIFGDGTTVVMDGLTNMLVGFFIGGALGLAQKNQKWILPLALSGMTGFGMYGLFGRLVSNWRLDLFVAYRNNLPLLILLHRTTWLTEILIGVVGGVIIGVCLGWTLRKSVRSQQGQWTQRQEGKRRYFTQKAHSLLQATEILKSLDSISALTYYTVDTPDGALGRDAQGFYTTGPLKTENLVVDSRVDVAEVVECVSLRGFGDERASHQTIALLKSQGEYARLVLLMECGHCGYQSPVETQEGEFVRECYCCGTKNRCYRANIMVFIGTEMVSI